MFEAAQAAGLVPETITRDALGWSSPERARARALAAQAAEERRPKKQKPKGPPAERPTRRPTSPPEDQRVSPAAQDQGQPITAATLFDLITERGLRCWDRSDQGSPAPVGAREDITSSPVRFAFKTPAELPEDWKTQCVRPPFDTMWLEYPHLDMLCGALVTATDNDNDRFTIRFVTSSRVGSEAPIWWPGTEAAELDSGGFLSGRQTAIGDPCNAVAQFQNSAVTGAFDAVYTHLALINDVHARDLWPRRPDTTTPVLPARIRQLNGPVVLMWGHAPPPAGRSPLDAPRHSPSGHQVRGHQRRLRDGETTWVRPHRRGDGTPEGPRTYEIKQRGTGHRW
ncbi:MAG: hypothetical protein R2763_01370 [Mycobacterium sp.]